jgi:exosortase/archaeosortase family protein
VTIIVMAIKTSFKSLIIYVSLAVTIILIVFYLPNYYFLESATAIHTSAILSQLGFHAPVSFADGFAYVGSYAVTRECTGIQVIAVFLGLILPLPRVSWIKKALSLTLLSGLLYGANLFRIMLEYYLVDARIPWSLVHYPMGMVIGIIGVFLLVLVNNKIIPEFGEYVLSFGSLFQKSIQARVS